MALPLISLLIASVLALGYVFLAATVIRARRAEQGHVMSQPSERLQRAIRAHGNFSEYTPLFLILLTLIEMADSYLWWVSGLGMAFIIGRISHAYGILVAETKTPPQFGSRVRGMICTLTCLAAAALSGPIAVLWVVLAG